MAYGFGIISALLPFNLYYSQEARPYSIAIFLFLCMFWVLNNILSSNSKKMLVPILSLLFFSSIFLYSRSLFPLVITVCLVIILFFWRGLLYKNTDIVGAEKKASYYAILRHVTPGAIGLYAIFKNHNRKIRAICFRQLHGIKHGQDHLSPYRLRSISDLAGVRCAK
jgi:uncharacterized membrane protein